MSVRYSSSPCLNLADRLYGMLPQGFAKGFAKRSIQYRSKLENGRYSASISLESIPEDLYGMLPQLLWYDEEACVQTSLTNVFAAVSRSYGIPNLLANGSDDFSRLLNTRTELVAFLGIDPTKGTTSVDGIDIGLNRYLSNQAVNQNISIGTTVLSDNDSSFSYLSKLISAFAKGPVVFLTSYTEEDGGHAVAGVKLEIDDKNNNLKIDRGEVVAFIIDPLNPAIDYSPASISVAGLSESEAISLWNNTVRPEDNAKPFVQQVDIYEDYDIHANSRFLAFDYNQTYLEPSKNGDIWSLSKLTAPETVKLSAFTSICKSALGDSLDDLIGARSQESTVVFDFTSFLEDNELSCVLFSYFDEESVLENNLSFYQLADVNGSVIDPLTGKRLSPVDIGYREAALKRSQLFMASDLDQSDGDLFNRHSEDEAQIGSFSFNIKAINGMALLAPIVTTSAGDVWTTFAEANSDGMGHFQWRGGLSFGVEDLAGLGDSDFNDLHVILTILEINGVV